MDEGLNDREQMFWVRVRQGLLVIVGAIEEKLSIMPTTSDLRKQWRENLIRRDAPGE